MSNDQVISMLNEIYVKWYLCQVLFMPSAIYVKWHFSQAKFQPNDQIKIRRYKKFCILLFFFMNFIPFSSVPYYTVNKKRDEEIIWKCKIQKGEFFFGGGGRIIRMFSRKAHLKSSKDRRMKQTLVLILKWVLVQKRH